MQGRFPKKSCEFILNLLINAESNAEVKSLDTENLVVGHIQARLFTSACACGRACARSQDTACLSVTLAALCLGTCCGRCLAGFETSHISSRGGHQSKAEVLCPSLCGVGEGEPWPRQRAFLSSCVTAAPAGGIAAHEAEFRYILVVAVSFRALAADGDAWLQVNQAQKQRRRTYRAHGRINPYMCSPSHIELVLEQAGANVPAEKEKEGNRKRKAQRARDRRLLASGTTAAAT